MYIAPAQAPSLLGEEGRGWRGGNRVEGGRRGIGGECKLSSSQDWPDERRHLVSRKYLPPELQVVFLSPLTEEERYFSFLQNTQQFPEQFLGWGRLDWGTAGRKLGQDYTKAYLEREWKEERDISSICSLCLPTIVIIWSEYQDTNNL